MSAVCSWKAIPEPFILLPAERFSSRTNRRGQPVATITFKVQFYAAVLVSLIMSKHKNIPAKVFYICTGEKCKKRGSKEISKTLRDYVKDRDLDDIEVIRTHCTDNCKHGPVACLQPANEWHFHVDEHTALNLLKNWQEKD